ncbi:helix-turn-helix transcriptional regulator [Kineosporia sp. NBRC 101677]|uniref:helix-turn-helix transcriptional regulator n=1 Tax=Kineosporia sp. NBRC 101677 TaxID=3032197 RepID=UPI0024A0D465|nr:response regulator transcription factor [Kineosporia sp. NBRC 101677]GLY20153.1 helix-turn-helix transcriptional regulator [Kineosporia sp. NBRC 101677]
MTASASNAPDPRPPTPPGPKLVRVGVLATTRLDEIGVNALIERDPELVLNPRVQLSEADVLVVAGPQLSGVLLRQIREIIWGSAIVVVAVVHQLGEADLLTAVECRLRGMLWRAEATSERFSALIKTVAGGKVDLPREVQTRLLDDITALQRTVLMPRGLSASGLEHREIEVLALVADGLDTAETAQRLGLSERTVKLTISGLLERLELKNRTHAVAYALRRGLL